MANTLQPGDLRLGDILLYHGTGFIDNLIRLVDGGSYSHASVFDGVNILEAVPPTVQVRSVDASLGGYIGHPGAYVDVYRFTGAGGAHIGDPGLPSQPLSTAMAVFELQPERYAYEQILLLAMLCWTRRFSLPPGMGVALRQALEAAGDLVLQITAEGREPVICSELVYRCFAGAGAAYHLTIRGADLIAAAAAPLRPLTAEEVEVARAAENFLARFEAAKSANAAAPPPPTFAAMTAESVTRTDPNFVTPRDLQNSPSLKRVGRLEIPARRHVLRVPEFPVAATAAAPAPETFVAAASASSPGAVGSRTLSEDRSRYHSRLLIVKMRPDVLPTDQNAWRTASLAAFLPGDAPGIRALETMERANRIRRITPLSRRTSERARIDTPAGFRVMASFAPPPEADPTPDPSAGVSILEMHTDEETESLHAQLAADPAVEYVSLVPVRRIVTAPTTAQLAWSLTAIGWTPQIGAMPGGRVAVLDTGVDTSHPAFAPDRIKSYTWEHPVLSTASTKADIVGHGTHVCGIIGAASWQGIRGISSPELHVWKIFNDRAVFLPDQYIFSYVVDPAMYLRALDDCLEQKFDAINLSIGGPGEPDPHERSLFAKLIEAGTTIVAAMGNERDRGNPTEYPAALPGVVAVAAIDQNLAATSFSNTGPHCWIAAPGRSVLSTLPTYPGQTAFKAMPGPGGRPVPGNPYSRAINQAAWDGTSMATPHVTAAAALCATRYNLHGAGQVREALKQSARKVPGMHGRTFSTDYGFGVLDLSKLLHP